MKIAARKTHGAWFRTNAQISGNTRLGITPIPTEDREALITFLVGEMTFLDPYFNALQSLQAESGIVLPEGAPTTSEGFIRVMIEHGIPLQVWMGRLNFTTYARSGELHARVYTANYVEHARNFGNELRGFLKRFLFARRQMRDVFNQGSAKQGNPGGLPDAHFEPAGT